MNKAIKASFAAVAGMATIAGALANPVAVSAWGDNGGGRPSYTVDQINKGVLGNKIVFNSISDSVDGDEKNFLSAQAATDDIHGTWQGNNITVENGKEYTIRLYVHNNNPNGYDAIARDTKAAISIPTTSGKQVQVNGFITSSNATPSKYWDYVNFNSDNNAFHLEYVYGSALLYNNKIGVGGLKISDDVVEKAASQNGTLIGYDALDGNVPGCYTYDNYVTVRVKAVYDTDYTVTQKVRVIGGVKEWTDYVNAKVGDTVEFQMEYKNITNGESQDNVSVRDILPSNLEYIPNTTKLWNEFYDGGLISPDTAMFGNGINIGGYNPGANAYVRFRAKVVDQNLGCGTNTLVNWIQGGVGKVTIQDYASVLVNKVCENKPDEPDNPDKPDKPDVPSNPSTPDTPTKLPSTGPEAIAGGVIAAGSIVTAAGYFIASRRALR